MTERCEACNRETDTPHTISVMIAAETEGTELSAFFDEEHCPGGCDQSCPVQHGSTRVAR